MSERVLTACAHCGQTFVRYKSLRQHHADKHGDAPIPNPPRYTLAAAEQWQPIETAPKDGTSILVVDHGGTVREAGWWDRWYGDTSNPGWMIANCDEEYGIYVAATHWMPLPPPPGGDHS